jgi:hypothetical protein
MWRLMTNAEVDKWYKTASIDTLYKIDSVYVRKAPYYYGKVYKKQ